MRLLLDTHIFLWCIRDDSRLTKPTRTKIQQASEVYVSSASIWEIQIKMNIKKLSGDIREVLQAIDQSNYLELPITSQHVAVLSQLSDHHRDPFDRILIAQATFEPLTFLTADAQLKKYSDLVELVDS